jgi:hypothetical protein
MDWFNANKLSLNISKTNDMVISQSSSPKCNIFIKNNLLKQTNVIKFLGVYIDERLNWKKHIECLNKKISSGVYMLKINTNLLPTESLVQSYLTYGIICWGSANKTSIKKTEILQKKAIRQIKRSSYNAHTDPLFESLEILKVNDLYSLEIAKLMYDLKKGNLPYALQKLFTPVDQVHNHFTRQTNETYHQFVRTKRASNCLTQIGTKTWSSLPHKFQNASTKSSFSKMLKLSLTKSYMA